MSENLSNVKDVRKIVVLIVLRAGMNVQKLKSVQIVEKKKNM